MKHLMKEQKKVSGNSLAKNAIFNIFYRVLNVIFPLITAAYVARVLEPEGVGKVAYAQNIVSYFVMFAVLGIPRYGTREIAKCRHNPDARNKLFSELIIINAVSTLLCGLGYYTSIFCGLTGDSVIYLVCGTELLFNFINIDWFYQGEEEYVYITLRSILIKVLSVFALFAFVRDNQDYPAYALITCFGLGCNNIFNVVHARTRVKLTFRELEFKKHLKPIMFLALSAVAASLYNKVDITMLGLMAKEDIVAYYVNANKVISMLLTLVTAISGVFMPRLSLMYEIDRAQFEKLITKGVEIVLLLAIPCCVGLILVAKDAVQVLFGVQFLPTVPAMRILSCLIVVIGVCDLLCLQAIISSGHERFLIWSRVVAGITNLTLNAFLIPSLQHIGAAIASVISEIIVNGMIFPMAMKIVRPQIERSFFINLLFSTVIMSSAVWVFQSFVDNPFLRLFLSIVGGIVAFGAVLLLTKNKLISEIIGRWRQFSSISDGEGNCK